MDGFHLLLRRAQMGQGMVWVSAGKGVAAWSRWMDDTKKSSMKGISVANDCGPESLCGCMHWFPGGEPGMRQRDLELRWSELTDPKFPPPSRTGHQASSGMFTYAGKRWSKLHFCMSKFVDGSLWSLHICVSIMAGCPVFGGENSHVRLFCRRNKRWIHFYCFSCFVFIVDVLIYDHSVESFTDLPFYIIATIITEKVLK